MTKETFPDPNPAQAPGDENATGIPAVNPADSSPGSPIPDVASLSQPATDQPPEEHVPHIHRMRIALNVGVQLLLGLVLYGLVNYLASRHFKQWDFTYDRKFTLADTTVDYLKKVTVPIRVTVLAERGKDPEKDLSALLQQYKDKMKGKLEIKIIDTLRDTNAWENFRLQFKSDTQFDTNGVLVQADTPGKSTANQGDRRWIKESELYDLDEQTKAPRSFKGESLLNSAIQAVTTPDKPKLGVVLNLGEPRKLQDGSSAFNIIRHLGELQNYEVEPYQILSDQVADMDALIWFSPGNVTNRETAILQSYLEKPGHSLVVFLDPMKNTPDLDKFLALYGIVPQQDHVIRTVKGIPFNDIEGSRFLDAGLLTQGIVSKSTSLFGQTRSLKIESGSEKQRSENIEVKPVLAASDEYWGETDMTAIRPEYDEATDNKSPLYLIASAERGAAKDPRVQVNSSRLLVFGNSVFADPGTVNDTNYDFLGRSINWLMHRDVVASNDSATDKLKHRFRIQIKPEQWQRIFWTTTIILPLAALMTGLMVWSSRRS